MSELYWLIGTVVASAIAATASILVATKRAKLDQDKIDQAIIGDERALFFKELQELRQDNKDLRETERALGLELAELKARLMQAEAEIDRLTAIVNGEI